MIPTSSSNRQTQLPALIILLVALVLIFIHPADPREDAGEKLIAHSRSSLIPVNSTDSHLVAYNSTDDSLQKILHRKTEQLKGKGNGIYILFAGTKRIDEPEPDSVAGSPVKAAGSKYYISFEGFALKKDARFRIGDNDYFIDHYYPEKKSPSGDLGGYEEKKTNVRLAVPGYGKQGLTLMLPISRSFYNIMQVVMYILLGICIIGSLWLFIRMPVKLLINIAKGKPFLDQNIRYLRWIGWGIISLCLAMALVPKLIQLILSSHISSDIYFPFWPALFGYRWGLFLGIAVLMMANAFKRGYEIQKEQVLTI